MSVWKGESSLHLSQCLESLGAQTLPADEILIVKDGPLGEELESVLHAYSGRLPIRALQQERNLGTGAAVRIGVEACSHELIARMDSDDVCVPRRFEMQLRFLEAHPEIAVLGGMSCEFQIRPEDASVLRSVPVDHEAIRRFAMRRSPVNQPTVLFRKSAVLAAGNYRSWIGFEDYDLWVRMLHNGARFHNLEEVLVFSRCGNGFQNRRGGWAYLKREASLFWYFREIGFLTTGSALRSVACRALARLTPAAVRGLLYSRFLRRPAVSAAARTPAESEPTAFGTTASRKASFIK